MKAPGGALSVVLMFPGQGSQFVGMGREVYYSSVAARSVFHEVDEILGRHLSRIIFQGPEEALTSTCNAQLALMTVSIALVRALEENLGGCITDVVEYVAGHSVGEYAALHVAGVLGLPSVAKLLDVRGKAMRRAESLCCGGGMAALIGGDLSDVESVVERASVYGVCEIANDNCVGQVVVSGVEDALQQLPKLIEGTDIRKVVRLRVSGPFHSSLMRLACDEISGFVEQLEMHEPKVGVVFNVSASASYDCGAIKDLIVRQVVGRVRWRESIEYLVKRGCVKFVEVGPGQVLTGLLKRIDRSVSGFNVDSMESIRASCAGVLSSEKFAESSSG
ncbi:ACP S-malonyltransferase [Anaplasma capra]|uniref:ACP S-malonyltransferase n=1 Tax=Anaplasma capra TaxID=1562740 RepID=UPI0021D58D2E|nr:ACP S-malonyltransferase [Anaplasma capra]MCU7611755.1 ACP S-malonyltransferase [Anaplasma capra]MCU7612494.1 ACP S-malonyltransferase [Anaplasma capra]